MGDPTPTDTWYDYAGRLVFASFVGGQKPKKGEIVKLEDFLYRVEGVQGRDMFLLKLKVV